MKRPDTRARSSRNGGAHTPRMSSSGDVKVGALETHETACALRLSRSPLSMRPSSSSSCPIIALTSVSQSGRPRRLRVTKVCMAASAFCREALELFSLAGPPERLSVCQAVSPCQRLIPRPRSAEPISVSTLAVVCESGPSSRRRARRSAAARGLGLRRVVRRPRGEIVEWVARSARLS